MLTSVYISWLPHHCRTGMSVDIQVESENDKHKTRVHFHSRLCTNLPVQEVLYAPVVPISSP